LLLTDTPKCCKKRRALTDLARARASFEGKAELKAFNEEQAEGEMTSLGDRRRGGLRRTGGADHGGVFQ
jgi:hypothetical protein